MLEGGARTDEPVTKLRRNGLRKKDPRRWETACASPIRASLHGLDNDARNRQDVCTGSCWGQTSGLVDVPLGAIIPLNGQCSWGARI